MKGAIVIARYGAGWRGIKPKVAGEHGAIGCIIYSDPRGDGYFQGDEYPKGGMRPPEGVQRGSVMDTDYPGDPLTPGVGATADAKRLPIAEAQDHHEDSGASDFYGDAQPLLAAHRQGPSRRRIGAARCRTPITSAPVQRRVHLKVASNWDIKPIYDVIAQLHGSDSRREWVIRGNHHDAWVNGADDPISGQSAMLEEARALGALHKQGWTPKRTIIYCAWDGEEPGLLGSVEWVETHLAELRQHAIAYFNSDSNERGHYYAGGTQDLQDEVSGVARDVEDPETHMTVFERARLTRSETPRPRKSDRLFEGPIWICLRSEMDRILRRFRITRESRQSIWDLAARTMRISTTRSTTISTGTRTSSTPISRTAERSHRLKAQM